MVLRKERRLTYWTWMWTACRGSSSWPRPSHCFMTCTLSTSQHCCWRQQLNTCVVFFQRVYGKKTRTAFRRFWGKWDCSTRKTTRSHCVRTCSRTCDLTGQTSKQTTSIESKGAVIVTCFHCPFLWCMRASEALHIWHFSKLRTRCFLPHAIWW